MSEYISGLTLDQAIWLNHYQIIAIEKEDTDWKHPVYGSCFCLLYKGKKYIITADHVIHYADHIETKSYEPRSIQEYNYFLIKNKNSTEKKTLESEFLQVFGFNYFDNVNLGEMNQFTQEELDEIGATIYDFTDKVDLAISRIENFPHSCVSHKLESKDGRILCSEGLSKVAITDGSYTLNVNKEDLFYIYGVIDTDIQGIRITRKNVTYCGMTLHENSDKVIKLKTDFTIKYNEWQQLSGSAVYNQKGHAIGMAISVDEDNSVVNVLPMSLILKYIDMIEFNIKKTVEKIIK